MTVEYGGGSEAIHRTTLEAERTRSDHWQSVRAT